MTKIFKKIKCQCSCGNIKDIEIYDSVDTSVNPELLEKIKNREINSFHCEKCGFRREIIKPFLFWRYFSQDNKFNKDKLLVVFVYPKGYFRITTTEEEAKQEQDPNILIPLNMIKDQFNVRDVYGFDELLKLIKQYERKN